MEKKTPYLVAILILSIYAAMFMISKAALDEGMDSFVFVFYRQASATLFLTPLSLIIERKGAPPLTFSVVLKIFFLSLFGISLSLNLYGVALKHTSASLAAATTNTLPAITFFLALIFRMETLNLRTISGTAKVSGIIICVAGAGTIAFYRGPCLKFLTHYHLLSHKANATETHGSYSHSWVSGTFLMLSGNILWGFWLVLQGGVLKCYPSKLLFTSLQCFMSTVQSFFLALYFQRDPSEWQLGSKIRILSVIYCGVIVTGVSFYLQSWCVEKRGPVFLAMFTPLSLVITTILSSLLLGELIHVGSVLGGLLMVAGLYSVLWGKNREEVMPIEVEEKQEQEQKDIP